jgi:ribose 5-phosphate isomerase
MVFSDVAYTKISWRKAEIQDLLKGFGHNSIRSKIIEILSKEMNITIEEARNMKTLRPSIVKIILSNFE